MIPTTGKLEDEYVWATDCQLTTLAQLCKSKHTTAGTIARQLHIVEHMLHVCQEHSGNTTWTATNSRVHRFVQEDNLHGALRDWAYAWFRTCSSELTQATFIQWLETQEKS